MDSIFGAWRASAQSEAFLFLLMAVLAISGLYVFQRRQRKIEWQSLLCQMEGEYSAERLKLATEASGTGIWEFDPVGQQLFWDDTMLAIYGVERPSFAGVYETWRKRVLAEDLPAAEAKLRDAIAHVQLFEAVFRIRRPDGQVRTIQAQAKCHCDASGKVVRLIGINRGITEQKRAESDALESRAVFSSIHDSLAQNIAVIDAAGMIVMVNQCWRDYARSNGGSTLCEDAAGLSSVKVAINLAARHFIVPGLSSFIADTLNKNRLDAHCLEIEITEGAMMQDVVAAVRNTSLLKQVGVRISLDDFGTGYSSLAYMSRFPIDVVKIDKSFVNDITTNPVNAAIAQATIAMSHKLGKSVLAEGVETEEQMRYLRRNECDEMQGYYFSGALPAKDVASMLRAGAAMDVFGCHAPEKKSTVLFVDDEANILSSIKRTLRREGYEILTASNADEGFSLLAKYPVQLIVSDQRMPEMSGTEFLARVKNLYPETVRIVLSGYSEISAVTDAINKGAVYRFMLKPWDDEKLKEEVSGALRHWRELYGTKDEIQGQ